MTPQISFQLYSSRKFPPLEKQLSSLAKLGYRNVEPFSALYDDPNKLKVALDAAGLKTPSGHFGLDALTNDFAGTIATAHKLGMSLIVCPYIQPDQRPKDAAGWKELARRLGVIAGKIKAEALRFAWHNHDFEFHPLTDGSLPMEHLVAERDLYFELDVAWLIRGAADPLAWIDRAAGRIAACHVKDIAPPGEKADEDGWADVGEGIVPWEKLWPLIVKAGSPLMIAEHDNPADFERFAATSLAAMNTYARKERS